MPRRRLCNCPNYAFPHRKGSGDCIWNPRFIEPRCIECGQVCQVVTYNKMEALSDCCQNIVVREGKEVISVP